MPSKKIVTLGGERMHDKTYFTAQDLKPGMAYRVTVRMITKEKMHNPETHKEEIKPVIYFERPVKGTVLGVEFSESVAQALGVWEAQEWIGKEIIIARTVVRKDKRGDTEGIRARAASTNHATSQPVPVDEDTTQYVQKDEDIESEYWTWVKDAKIDKTAAIYALENAAGDYDAAKAALLGTETARKSTDPIEVAK